MAQRRQQPARRPTRGPVRRRRGFLSRFGERGVALSVLGAAAVAIGGVAVAGALTSKPADSVQTQADNNPSPAVQTASPTPSPTGPLGPLAPSTAPTPTHKPSPVQTTPPPKPTKSPSPAAVVETPKPTPSTAKPVATSSPCASRAQRVEAARKMLQHREALPNATLITEGPRQGLLGSSDFNARTVTLYVRSCADEPLIQLAVVWGYEAGQFIATERWDAATRSKWRELRGTTGLATSNELKQDAASVYAFWQTGSTKYWQSPLAPPSFSQLSKLVPYLKTS